MDATLHITMREALKRLVRGEISLADFEAWFDPVLWAVESSENPAAIDLAYEIAGQFAEYSYGHWSHDDLLANFADLVEQAPRPVASGGEKERARPQATDDDTASTAPATPLSGARRPRPGR